MAGRADPASDEEGLRQAWVERQIRLAKARDTGGRGKKPPPDGVEVAPAERAQYLEEVYDDTKIEDKPRNFIGMAKSIPAEQMEALLRGAAPWAPRTCASWPTRAPRPFMKSCRPKGRPTAFSS